MRTLALCCFENRYRLATARHRVWPTQRASVRRYGQYTVPGYSAAVVAADPFAIWQDDGADAIGLLVVATADQPVTEAVVMLYVSFADGM